MGPLVTVWPHPVTTEGRETRLITIDGTVTAADLVHEHLPDAHPDEIVVALDGEILPPGGWDAPVPLSARQITISIQPGRDILRVVALIAISVVAPYATPALFPGLTAGTFAFAAATAGIAVVGGILVNALIPVRGPDLSGPENREVAPVFSLSGGGNRARLYEPLPLVFGRHRIFPDVAAREFTEYDGDDQILNTLLHFGLGDLDIESVMIGSSLLSSYSDVATEVLIGAPVTIFAGNVDTIVGGALDNTDWIERSTADHTDRIAVDIVGELYGINNQADIVARQVNVEIQWRRHGSADEWSSRTSTVRNDSQSPVRHTVSVDLADDTEWDVRVRRTTDPVEGTRERDVLQFAALRAYQADTGRYDGQTRYAMRIRASGQLSGRLDQVSAIAHQKVPIWEGGAWTADNRRSRNPAALFRWYARGGHVDGRLVYGAGLPDRRVDDTCIAEWYQWCATQGLKFDHVIQTAATHDEILGLIAQCGRASMTWASGRLGVVWEDEATDASGLVTPGNIVQGTFTVEWPPGGISDEIEVRFIDPDNDWQYSSVRRSRPGLSGAPSTSSTITLRGVTSAAHAAIECNLAAARQQYHRRRLSWEMAHEGRGHVKGDVVYITHSLIDGGVAGRLIGIRGTDVTLDRPVTVDDQSWIVLRRSDGRVHTSRVQRQEPGDDATAALSLDDAPDGPSDIEGIDVLWRVYNNALPPRRVRITGVEPVSDRRFKFTAIDEVAGYHAAATSDLTVPLPPARRRTPRVVSMALSETLVRVSAGYAVRIEAVLTVDGDWRGGVVIMSVDSSPAQTVATLTRGATRANWSAPPVGNAVITVIPGSEIAPLGRPFVQNYIIQGLLFPPNAPNNFLLDVLGDGTRRLRWTPSSDPDLAGVIIRYYATGDQSPPDWRNMLRLHRGHLTASPLETVEPGPGAWTFVARSIDTSGVLSTDDVQISAEIGAQRQGGTALWACPSASGWPGTVINAQRSDDGRDALEIRPDYTWSEAMWDWAGSDGWATGDGDAAADSMTYRTEPQDLSVSLVFALGWVGETVGDVTFQVRHGATEAALLSAEWADYVDGTTITARWVQVQWIVTGDGTRTLSVDHLCWSVLAPSAVRRLLDVNTVNWPGSASTGRVVPHDLSLVSDVDLVLQSVTSGWTWSLESKSPLTIKIFDGNGNAADAVIDMTVRGIS